MAFLEPLMHRSDTNPTEALLAECAWLRALARRLVNDPERAEDAVQDTLVAALERPAGASFDRGWLATVLRNALRQRFRGGARRRDRERSVARAATGTSPAAAEVAARLSVQRRVFEAVEALDEPYRTSIVLRFFDGHSPREVARRMDTPVKTVHTRIDRGLARLRVKLDREHGGDRAQWLAALAPFARTPVLPASLTLGVLVMNAKWTVVGAAAVLALAGAVAWQWSDAEPVALGERVAAAPAALPLEPPADTGGGASREGIVPRLAPRGEPVPSGVVPAAIELRGRVRDVDGQAVPDVPVGFEATEDEFALLGLPYDATTDSGGAFTMPLPDRRGRLVAGDDRWASVVRPTLLGGAPPPEEPVIVVAPRNAYAGFVEARDGTRLAGAELVVSMGESAAESLGVGMFTAAAPLARARSGESGEFELDGVGFVPGITLRVGIAGYDSAKLALPAAPTFDLRVTLDPIDGDDSIVGRVVTADGAPVSDAYVALGTDTTLTGADGAFDLEVPAGTTEVELTAVAEGHLPARATVALPSDEVVLVLGGAPLLIEGVVVDGEGAPVAGAEVWTRTGTVLGEFPVRMGDVTLMMGTTIENVVAGTPSEARNGRRATTDESGRFVLNGLLPGDYDLFASHPRTLALTDRPGVPAGSPSVSLTLDRPDDSGRVAGRVVSREGEPVADVVVGLQRPLMFEPKNTRLAEEFEVRTGADGRFEFPSVCLSDLAIMLQGDAPFMSATYLVRSSRVDLASNFPDLEALELPLFVPTKCYLRVDLDGWEGEANVLQVRDESGKALPIQVETGGVTMGATAFGLSGGRLDRVTVPESARSVVLLRGMEEVARIPVVPRPGEVVEVRP